MLVKLYHKEAEGTVYNKYACETWRGEKIVNNYKIFRYCPECNSELFGEWNYHNRRYNINSDEIGFDVEIKYIDNGDACFKEPRYDEEARKKYLAKESEIKDITPLIKQYRKEIEEMENMLICPVCGMKLPPKGVSNTLVLSNGTLKEPGFVKISGEFITERGTILAPRSKWFNEKYEEYLNEFNNASIGDQVKCDSGRIGIKHSDSEIYLFDRDDMESILNNFRLPRENDFLENTNRRLEKMLEIAEDKEEQVNISADQIKSDVSRLKDFILGAVQIESNIFSVVERLKILYYMSIEDEREAFGSVKRMQVKEKTDVDVIQKEYDDLTGGNIKTIIPNSEVALEYPISPIKPKKDEYPYKPIGPVLKKVNIFNKKKATAENATLMLHYNEKLSIYEQQCKAIDEDFVEKLEKYNEECKKHERAVLDFEEERKKIYDEKVKDAKERLDVALKTYSDYADKAEMIATPEKAKYEMVKEEIAIAEELLKKLYAARNAIYKSGVIFDKYCNFIALSSFSEYLQSGRCTKLEGPDGAYNIYENEVRMNIVVCQLAQVIEYLEKIQENQYVIYSAISEANRQLSALNSTMKSATETLKKIEADTSSMKVYMQEIAKNTDVAAYYSKVNAYYSKKNAELTNALGFMVALK